MAQTALSTLRSLLVRFGSIAIVSLLVLSAVVAVTLAARAREQNLAEFKLRSELTAARLRLDAVAIDSLKVSEALEAVLRVQGELDERAFRLIVEPHIAAHPQLRSVVAAPQDRVRWYLPLQGNDRLDGLNYRSLPEQAAQVDRARRLGVPMIFAPVKLVQGGLGFVQRRPVFLNDAHGKAQYWGLLATAVDINALMLRAGLHEGPVELALAQRRADGLPGDLIWGDAALLQDRQLQEAMRLPGADWVLLARPRGGWPAWQAWRNLPTVLSAVVGALLIGLTALLARRRVRLSAQAAQMNAEIAQRRASQKQAEAAQAELQSLLNTASDWFWRQDADFRLRELDYPRDAQRQAAMRQAWLGQQRWASAEQSPAIDWALHQQQLQAHEPIRDFVYPAKLLDGSRIWVSISGEPVFDEQAQFIGYRGVGRDVSAQREAQIAVRQARDELQTLLDAASQVAIMATDAEGRLVVFNRGAQQLLGYRIDEVLGQPLDRLNDPTALQSQLAALASPRHEGSEALHDNSPAQDWTLLARNGRRVPVSISRSAMRAATGKSQPGEQAGGDVIVAIDLTRERETQTALSRSVQRLQAVFDSADQYSIVVVGLDGRIERLNRGAERFLGVNQTEAIGRSCFDFHDAGELEAEAQRTGCTPGLALAHQAAGRDGGHVRYWTYINISTGERHLMHHSANLVRDADGSHVGYVAIARDITEERSLQQLAAAEQARLRSVVEAPVQVAMVATDLAGRITLFSRGAERMLGYRTDDVLGQTPHFLHLWPEVQARAQALSAELGREVDPDHVFALLARREQTKPLEWTYVCADGQHITVSQTLACLRDAQDKVSGYLGLMVNISAQRAAEEELQRSHARLQAIFDSSLDFFILLQDTRGKVLAVNRGAEMLTGFSAAEMLSRAPAQLLDRTLLLERLRAFEQTHGRRAEPLELFALQAKQPLGARTQVWNYLTKDGRSLPAALTINEVRTPDGHLQGYLSIARDMTQEMAQEASLRQARDRLQAVLDSALDIGILVVNERGEVELFNRGAQRLFDYAQHEVMGRQTQMMHDGHEVQDLRLQWGQTLGRKVSGQEAISLTLTADESAQRRWTLVRKGGERFPALLRLTRMAQGASGRVEYLAIVMDVTQQVQAEQALQELNVDLERRVEQRTDELRKTLSTLSQAQDELVRSERLAALGALVAGVAHELNTPLGVCTTGASTLHDRSQELQHELEGGQLRRSALERFVHLAVETSALLQRSLHDASELVQHFKQLSVDQTGEMRRPFALDTVVSDVLTVLRSHLKQHRLQIEVDIELPKVLDGYPGELGRLLTNLIQNAQLHAFEPGHEGVLSISARGLDDERFELSVSDNGKGMTEDVRRRAFDPFFTTKLGTGGSGLGLNLVYNIAVGVMGGGVELTSQPGQGSRFSFRLPYVAPQRADASAAMQPTQLGSL